MNENEQLARFVAEQLVELGPVQLERMFGGFGLRIDGTMFGMVVRGTLFLRTDDRLRADLKAAGSEPFSYTRQGREVVSRRMMSCPVDDLDDREQLAIWAGRALAAMQAEGA